MNTFVQQKKSIEKKTKKKTKQDWLKQNKKTENSWKEQTKT